MPNELPIITHVEFFKANNDPLPPVTVNARPFSSFSIRKSGKTVIRSGSTTLCSTPATLTFIPSGCSYTTEIPEGGETYLMHFYTSPEGGDFSPIPLCVRPPFPLSFYNLFENAISHFSSEGCDLFCMSTAYELLNEASAAFFQTRPAPPRRMLRCKEYLDENVCDTALRVGDLAEMCGVSEVYLRRLFDQVLGVSPATYVLHLRLQHARAIIQSGLYSMQQAAALSGFSDYTYFSRAFKKHFGVSPQECESQ